MFLPWSVLHHPGLQLNSFLNLWQFADVAHLTPVISLTVSHRDTGLMIVWSHLIEATSDSTTTLAMGRTWEGTIWRRHFSQSSNLSKDIREVLGNTESSPDGPEIQQSWPDRGGGSGLTWGLRSRGARRGGGGTRAGYTGWRRRSESRPGRTPGPLSAGSTRPTLLFFPSPF